MDFIIDIYSDDVTTKPKKFKIHIFGVSAEAEAYLIDEKGKETFLGTIKKADLRQLGSAI